MFVRNEEGRGIRTIKHLGEWWCYLLIRERWGLSGAGDQVVGIGLRIGN